MSTRGAIARKTETGFAGVYHHWDGYPEGLGATLFDLRNGLRDEGFAGDSYAMLSLLIDKHPAGWSTICGKDLTLDAGFIEYQSGLDCRFCGLDANAHLCQSSGPSTPLHKIKYPCGTSYAFHVGHQYEADPIEQAAQDRIPQCYCHGSRHEAANIVDETNAAGIGVEYVYVIDGARMTILSSYSGDQKMVGMFGMGDAAASWQTLATVNLDGPAPDWATAVSDEVTRMARLQTATV